MNKQITRLAEQAGLYVDLNGRPYPKSMSAEECIAAYQKFAQLIIKECMSCADFVGITNDRIGLGPMPIRYTSMVNDQIKKHFGVEE